MPLASKERGVGMRAEGSYLAATGFSVAWWVGYTGVLGFRPGRRVEIYDPLWRRRWIQ